MEAIKRLVLAVSDNDLKTVQSLAATGSSLQCRDEHGHSPVSTAAREGHLEMLRWLLSHGGNANSLGCNDHPAIVLATLAGHVEIVSLLLDHLADPNRSRASGGETALHAAAIGRHVDIVRLLVEAGAQVNIHTAKHVESDFLWNVLLTSDTPLHLAACYGPEAMVECLLALGANPRLENYRQETPLACALRMRRPAAVLAPLRGERYSAWSDSLPVRKAIVA
jgi:ankyrin repeat protein